MDGKRQCNFFVAKRKRLCRLIPAKGKRFCGEHINHEGNDSGSGSSSTTNKPNLERIPCPYDAHHTVSVKQLEKHLKVCNSRPKEQPAYYQKGVNAGGTDVDDDTLLLRLSSFSLEEIREIISKVEKAYTDCVGRITTQVLHHDALKPELDNPGNGVSARKHLVQLDSLLGHMTRLRLLQPATCFVEFGAGRGRLSQWIQQAMEKTGNLENASFLLVERAAVRHKRDSFYQREGDGHHYERIHMDIQNLVLGKVPAVHSHPNRPIVAYTKHLCGAATDLALRCLMETRSTNGERQASLLADGNTESRDTFSTSSDERKDKSSAKPTRSLEGDTTLQRLCDHDPKTNSLNIGRNSVNTILADKRQCMGLHHKTSDSIKCGILDNAEVSIAAAEQISDDAPKADQSCSSNQSGKLPLVSNPVKGIVMALCCHHRCAWRTHVGKEFFRDVGISKWEFMALVRMSSWATCGTRAPKMDGGIGGEDNGKDVKDGEQEVEEVEDGVKNKDGARRVEMQGSGASGGSGLQGGETLDKKEEESLKSEGLDERSMDQGTGAGEEEEKDEILNCMEEQESIVSSLGLSVPEREELGFKCKRILDMGRLLYLQNRGLHAELVYYVDRDISPENAVLIATPLDQ